ncbi:MAG: hypothetical protein ACM65L_21655 [Microcoleus sp.]
MVALIFQPRRPGRACQVLLDRVPNSQLAEHAPRTSSGCVQVLTYSYCCLRTATILPDRGIGPHKSFRSAAGDGIPHRATNDSYSPTAASYKVLDLFLHV